MRVALALAERGRGTTSPNPMVGALVVSDEGVVVGAGHHARAGAAHAEIRALEQAGPRARGATLYCTLEPCCHTGRTGPCAPAVADAGIRRVVAAMRDPNPLVAGGGFALLRARGVQVATGVLEAEARRLNEVFVTTIEQGRPFVTVKIAMSLDGRIAAAPGARTDLTGASAQRHAHGLRAEVDGIGVGSATVLADDPLLTAREVYRGRPLVRVLFDRRLRTPPTARVFSTLAAGPVLVVTTPGACAAAADRARALADAGATLVASDAHDVRGALAAIMPFGVRSLLLEGGAALHASAWEAGVVDRVRIYVAPRALGPGGVPWTMPQGLVLAGLGPVRAQPLGADVLLEADVHRTC